MASGEIEESRIYPAVHHFRIIVSAEKDPAQALARILAPYSLHSPLERANRSSSGKYVSYCVSVLLASRNEHARLDGEIKSIDGVKMLI